MDVSRSVGVGHVHVEPVFLIEIRGAGEFVPEVRRVELVRCGFANGTGELPRAA